MPQSLIKTLDESPRVITPVKVSRRASLRNLSHSVTNGFGIISGFVLAQTSPASKLIWVSRGLAVGPDGKILDGIGADPTWDQNTYNRNLIADSVQFDLSRNLESLSGAYSTLDPASHAILLTLDLVNERLRCLKITTAEKTAIDTAIGAGETGEAAGAGGEFDNATADHRARLHALIKNPDGVPTAASGGVLPTLDLATEVVLGTITLAAIGTVTATVAQRRERKQAMSVMIVA